MHFDPQEIRNEIRKTMEEYPSVLLNEPLTDLEGKTNVPKEFLLIGAFMLFGVVLFAFGGASLLIDVIGFLYPAYASFKAVESNDKEDDTLWLTYWVVYAFFKVFESVADVVVSWIPFYFFIKLGFLVWCYYPGTHGASIIYNKLLRPYLVKAMMELNDSLDEDEGMGEEKVEEGQLSVTVIEAANLRVPHTASEEDEDVEDNGMYNYVLSIVPVEGMSMSSLPRNTFNAIQTTARGVPVSLNDSMAVWEEQHNWLSLEQVENLQLCVQLVRTDTLSDSRFPTKLGSGYFPLSTLQPGTKRKANVTLQSAGGSALGDVKLSLHLSG